MSRIGHVREIWRHPVKSMGGERIQLARIGACGVPGDRAFAVRDERAGEIRGARNLPDLLLCEARYQTEPGEGAVPPAHLTLPEGVRTTTDDPRASELLSEFLGRPVTLCGLRPADDVAHYRRAPLGADPVAAIREVLGRVEGEPLPDFTPFPSELLQFVSPPGTYFDAFPLHLVTTSSLAYLRGVSPGSDADPRRFRANLVIDTDEEGLVEIAWCGRTLRIGEALVDVEVPAFRCGIPTRPQPGLDKDPAILRAIVRHAAQNLGVYARVRSAGHVAIGDGVRFA